MKLQLIREERRRWDAYFHKYFGTQTLTLSSAIKPCTISFSDKQTKQEISTMLEDVQDKIEILHNYRDLRLRHPEDIQSDINEFLNKVLTFWTTSLLQNCKEEERYINSFPHFITNIDEIDVHFVYVTPRNTENKRVLPLLMLHGWPSSVIEFYKAIPALTQPRDEYDIVFEVVIPSLPGFGFSGTPVHEDLTCEYVSDILIKLMIRLGHDQFYVHCDDWSSLVACTIATLFPQNLYGVHYALCHVTEWSNLTNYLLETIKRRKTLEQMSKQTSQHYDKSSPAPSMNTLLLCTINSPASYIAYFIDKYVNGSNCPKESTISRDLYLTFSSNFLMHCPSNNIANTIRTFYRYYKFNSDVDLVLAKNVFTAVSMFVPEHNSQTDTLNDIKSEDNMVFHITRVNSTSFPAYDQHLNFINAIFIQINKHFMVSPNK